jgi:hypothetical protein
MTKPDVNYYYLLESQQFSCSGLVYLEMEMPELKKILGGLNLCA